MTARLVILDRDGVINHDSDDFIKTPDEWRPIDGSLDAIARLAAAGFRIAIATNQSGIGRGLMTSDDLAAIHEKMLGAIRQAGGTIDHIAYCPHHPDDGCDCRKPLPGMLHEIGNRLGTGLRDVPVIGDTLRDLQAASAAGARPVLVLTGNGERTQRELEDAGMDADVFPNLAAVADALAAEPA